MGKPIPMLRKRSVPPDDVMAQFVAKNSGADVLAAAAVPVAMAPETAARAANDVEPVTEQDDLQTVVEPTTAASVTKTARTSKATGGRRIKVLADGTEARKLTFMFPAELDMELSIFAARSGQNRSDIVATAVAKHLAKQK